MLIANSQLSSLVETLHGATQAQPCLWASALTHHHRHNLKRSDRTRRTAHALQSLWAFARVHTSLAWVSSAMPPLQIATRDVSQIPFCETGNRSGDH